MFHIIPWLRVPNPHDHALSQLKEAEIELLEAEKSLENAQHTRNMYRDRVARLKAFANDPINQPTNRSLQK